MELFNIKSNITTKIYPKTPDEVKQYINKFSIKNAQEYKMTLKDYEKHRLEIKQKAIKNSYQVVEFIKIIWSWNINWIKNWMLKFTNWNIDATAYITIIWQKKTYFWAFSHFSKFKN